MIFGYNLEDTDNGVFNGADSVLWCNLRDAFPLEITAMYRQFRARADGKFTYASIEKRFDDHQAIWPEAIWIEEAKFSYIEPLINSGKNYLTMMQGSKEMQRKWWLKNRLRFMDSKWTAGDATKHIILRGYANANITLTPYIDLYCTILYGSQTVQQKTTRGTAVTLLNPLDRLNDTEIHIYSAEQIASVGDLSGLKVGFSDFSAAINLQYVKIGDASSSYRNENALDLTFGNNVLLETVDARNCVNLGGSRNDGTMVVNSTTPTIDMSNCTGLLAAYFDNTSIKGVEIPRGCPIAHLHLPATTTTLKLLDLKALTDLVVASYANTTTLWIENCNSAVDPLAILDDIQTNSRVRIIGFEKTVSAVSEIEEFYNQLDSMRGLDESGNTTDKAQVSGTIHISTMTGAKYSELTARYPYITLDVASVESIRTYKTWDGSSVVATVTCLNGVPQSAAPTVPARSSTAQYAYAPAGWSLNQDSYTADFDPASTTMGDTTVYAAYTRTVRTYTITWVNNGTTIETDTNVPYGATPQYNGTTPTKDGQTSTGWSPTPTTVTGNQTYTATYLPSYSVYFYNGSTLLYTDTVIQGGTASYSGSTPVNSEDSSLAFLGWGSSSSSTSADAVLTNIQGNKSVYAVFESAVQVAEIADDWDTIIQKINNGTADYKIGNYKPLDFGTEGTINMQIVGVDQSELASGGGTAKYDWLGIELLKTTHKMNPKRKEGQEGTGALGGWDKCEMKTYLNNTIFPLIPSNVRSAIKSVKKYTRIYDASETVVNNSVSTDTLWIPSMYEMGWTEYETSGGRYNSIFNGDASRVKNVVGASSSSRWWLRSAVGVSGFYYVTLSGEWGSTGSNNMWGVAVGFSL